MDRAFKISNKNIPPFITYVLTSNNYIFKVKKLGKMGLLSVNVSKDYGGAGLDTLALALTVEEISKGCGGTGAIVSIHNCLYANLIDRCGNHEQKLKFLSPLNANGDLGCFALSEPG